MPPWLIVALGNPGQRHAETRHNIGWRVADLLAQRVGAGWAVENAWRCEIARAPDFLMIKPLTYINLSGDAVLPTATYFKIPPERILVILDDIALPFETLRLRPAGSDGGHNGLKSISARLGTEAYPRLRLGIGGATPEERAHLEQPLADFVLSPFTPAEQARLPVFLQKAADCVECALNSGVDAAMNRFNRKTPAQRGDTSDREKSSHPTRLGHGLPPASPQPGSGDASAKPQHRESS